MKPLLFIFLAQAGLARAACPANVLAYHAYWKTSTYPSSAIPYNKLTHIAHAFVLPRADGSLDVDPNFLDPNLNSSAAAAGVKVLVSVGGESGADDFNDMANSPGARANFCAQLEAFMRANNYQGVDLDWENPLNLTEKANLNLLVQEIRAKFNSSPAPAPTWLITMATPGSDWYGKWFDFATLKNTVDFFNVMAYPFHGNWENHSGFNAPLFQPAIDAAYHPGLSSSSSLNYYINTRGVPASKINFGVPFYGRHFKTENMHDSCPGGCEIGGSGIPYYTTLPKINNGWTRTFDTIAASPVLKYDTAPGVITYEDPQSIAIKCEYALETRGCAGVFMWALYQDYLGPGNQPLLDAMHSAAACGPLPAATQTALALNSQATFTPTYAPTEIPHPADPKLMRSLAVPNPNAEFIQVESSEGLDVLRLTLFSSGYAKALQKEFTTSPGATRHQLRLGNEIRDLTNGVYHYAVTGAREGKQTSKIVGRLVILR